VTADGVGTGADANFTFLSSRFKNRQGLGSAFHTFAQRMCYALEVGALMRIEGMWKWADYSGTCPSIGKRQSSGDDPFRCYFGEHVGGSRCGNVNWSVVEKAPPPHRYGTCPSIQNLEVGGSSIEQYMSAAMEWLFQSVNPTVIAEAERQLADVFPHGAPHPDDLITVHIRRGDKVVSEMPFQSIDKYVNATKRLVATRPEERSDMPVHVYIASMDQEVLDEFREAAPEEWVIHKASNDIVTATNVTGEADAFIVLDWMSGGHGLQSLGALLVELQANRYVLTTRSNWSRLLNELRSNIIDPRCGGCTRMVDICYGQWPIMGPDGRIHYATGAQLFNGTEWVIPAKC